MAGPVHDLSADHRPVAHYRVCVELDDQVGGARAQQLGRSYWCGRDYNRVQEEKEEVLSQDACGQESRFICFIWLIKTKITHNETFRSD